MPLASPPTSRQKRPLRVPTPANHPFRTSDDTELLLTRYEGGSKGPVMLIHGLGVSSSIFTVDTIDTNLLEYLVEHGYDVWLLDYRSSIRLPASRTQYTADDIATQDIPRAVEVVRDVTGRDSVQVIAHCYGATTFTMAMLAGMTGVRSAVLSQISAHPIAPPLVQAKASLRLPEVLTKLGIESLDASPDDVHDPVDQLVDQALRLYPVDLDEQCSSEVCRRITFMYSLLYEHDQLNEATHETLGEHFGEATLRAFKGLTMMMREQKILNARGEDAYLPHLHRLAIPIRFIHGRENACYLPESTEKTITALRQANDPSLYSRSVIPGYGHIDCIFGKRAATDVYPFIVEHLEAT